MFFLQQSFEIEKFELTYLKHGDIWVARKINNHLNRRWNGTHVSN